MRVEAINLNLLLFLQAKDFTLSAVHTLTTYAHANTYINGYIYFDPIHKYNMAHRTV